ncbi:MAG: ligase-associated DNA damage response endonuclease PdeM [Gemmataceae bacterium]
MNFDLLPNTPIRILPAPALYLPAPQTLLVADMHWGKADTFRAAGVPIGDTLALDLARLSDVLRQSGARRLIILGDLFHAKAGKSPQVLSAISAWRVEHSELQITVIRGNHDRHAGDPPAAWGFECVNEPLLEPPLAFRHFPEPTPGHYTLAGHLHPSYTIRGRGRQHLKLPCFHFSHAVGILPAFGSFTGTAAVDPAPDDRLFLVADSTIVPWKLG